MPVMPMGKAAFVLAVAVIFARKESVIGMSIG